MITHGSEFSGPDWPGTFAERTEQRAFSCGQTPVNRARIP